VASQGSGEAPGYPFYRRLNAVLDHAGFDEFCEAQCHKFYHERLGRPLRVVLHAPELLAPLRCSFPSTSKSNTPEKILKARIRTKNV
jgi:hypothetical protein